MIGMRCVEGEREEREKKERTGEVGHRSQYLSHAKRALYHMSYIPASVTCVKSNVYFLVMKHDNHHDPLVLFHRRLEYHHPRRQV